MRSVHGQSIRPAGLRIAIFVAMAMSSSSCVLDSSFTRCEKTGLNCPPGWVCSADQDVCIKAGSCGNGIVSDGEVCDDGNNKSGDGCSSDCVSDESCGNFILDVAVGENCDDGNRIDGDGCSAGCRLERCGNYVVDMAADEECDTGPGDSVGCNADCTFRRCGDGYVNTAAGEECDVLDMVSDTETCDDNCTFPACGDHHTNPFHRPGPEGEPEACDSGGNTASCNGNDNSTGKGNCQRPKCGDGYHNPEFKVPGENGELEACDDGENTQECNSDDNDNSTAEGEGNCQEPRCGDGYWNKEFTPPGDQALPEQCDDARNTQNCNGNDNDNSTAEGKGNCQKPRCGDGYVNTEFKPAWPAAGPPEACDAGMDTPSCNGNGPGNDAAKCQMPRCGDGYVNAQFRPAGSAGPPEACDAGMDTPNCNGNGPGNDAAKCQEAVCGDGYFNSTMEQCDPDAPDPHGPCGQGKRCNPLCMCVLPS